MTNAHPPKRGGASSADVGKGQNFGLTTPKPRIVFDETKLAIGKGTQHFRLFTASLHKSSKGTMGRPSKVFKKYSNKSHPATRLQMNQSNTNAINEYNQNGNRALLSLLG